MPNTPPSYLQKKPLMQIEMCFDQYERYCIKGKPFVAGYPPLLPMSFAGLHPGDRVTQIGRPAKSGKATSASRFDNMQPWVEYAGIVELSGFSSPDKQKWMAFKLPPGGLMQGNEPVREPWYALYGIINETELVRNNYTNGTVEFFKTVFTLLSGVVINKLKL